VETVSEVLSQEMVAFRVMVRKQGGAIGVEGASEGLGERVCGESVRAGNARGEVDDAGFVGLTHEVDQARGGLKGGWSRCLHGGWAVLRGRDLRPEEVTQKLGPEEKASAPGVTDPSVCRLGEESACDIVLHLRLELCLDFGG
jgi:hypothetical protein